MLLPAQTGQAPFRRLARLDLGVFGCAANPAYSVFSSRAELLGALEGVASEAAEQGCRERRERLLNGIEEASLRWEEEALVVLEEYYGTGMARANLDLVWEEKGVLRAAIVWEVPPPPVTPDTAVCRFAFAVNKSAVTKVIVTGREGRPTSLSIPP